MKNFLKVISVMVFFILFWNLIDWVLELRLIPEKDELRMVISACLSCLATWLAAIAAGDAW